MNPEGANGPAAQEAGPRLLLFVLFWLVGWFFFFLAQSEGSARDAWPHVLGQDRKESR